MSLSKPVSVLDKLGIPYKVVDGIFIDGDNVTIIRGGKSTVLTFDDLPCDGVSINDDTNTVNFMKGESVIGSMSMPDPVSAFSWINTVEFENVEGFWKVVE